MLLIAMEDTDAAYIVAAKHLHLPKNTTWAHLKALDDATFGLANQKKSPWPVLRMKPRIKRPLLLIAPGNFSYDMGDDERLCNYGLETLLIGITMASAQLGDYPSSLFDEPQRSSLIKKTPNLITKGLKIGLETILDSTLGPDWHLDDDPVALHTIPMGHNTVAQVIFGKTLSQDDRHNAKHTYHPAVDADYDTRYGADGTLVLDLSHGTGVLKLTQETLQDWTARVPDINNPSILLQARVP